MAAVMQDGLPPHTMRCLMCGAEWQPEPGRAGFTEGVFLKSWNAHIAKCPGESRGTVEEPKQPEGTQESLWQSDQGDGSPSPPRTGSRKPNKKRRS